MEFSFGTLDVNGPWIKGMNEGRKFSFRRLDLSLILEPSDVDTEVWIIIRSENRIELLCDSKEEADLVHEWLVKECGY